MSFVKNLKVFLSTQILWKRPIHGLSLYSKWQKRLSRLQKCQSNIVRKCPFFLRGCPLICIKNRTFLLSLIFFEKDLDIMCKYLLNNIKNFLDYKNVILTYSKHDHFSKGGNPRFSSKICKFFWVSFSLKKTYTWCLIMFSIKKGFLDYKNVILT